MPLVLCVLAALAFTIGGIFMKFADGLRHGAAAAAFVLLFAAGAALLSEAMRDAELGTTYIIVLGLEASLALLFGATLFAEPVTTVRLGAVLLIVSGIALLRLQ